MLHGVLPQGDARAGPREHRVHHGELVAGAEVAEGHHEELRRAEDRQVPALFFLGGRCASGSEVVH